MNQLNALSNRVEYYGPKYNCWAAWRSPWSCGNRWEISSWGVAADGDAPYMFLRSATIRDDRLKPMAVFSHNPEFLLSW